MFYFYQKYQNFRNFLFLKSLYFQNFEHEKAVIILLTYLLNYYGINNIPNQVISVVKKIVQMKNNGSLVKLANAISWSQNENDAANVSLLPFIIIGAGHGTMSVKVSDSERTFVERRPSSSENPTLFGRGRK